MNVFSVIKGLIFASLWYGSILFGFITLYCPMLPLLFLSNKFFRKWTDKVFALWELYPTALLQLIMGTKIFIHGDYINPNEMAVVVMNHRTRVDWNYVWLCVYHATRKPFLIMRSKSIEHLINGNADILRENCRDLNSNGRVLTNGDSVSNEDMPKVSRKMLLNNMNLSQGDLHHKKMPHKKPAWRVLVDTFNQQHRLKFILKDGIRHIPGVGWVMQLTCFMYISRNWELDKNNIEKMLNYFKKLEYKCQLLIFPEGTDMTKHSMMKSDSFADRNHLQRYDYVLHPKTTGFAHIASSLMSKGHLDAVYDITIGYPCTIPQTELHILTGQFPEEVHFYIKRYAADTIPKGEDSLKQWLTELWSKKEIQLGSFYRHGEFIEATNFIYNHNRLELATALLFWTSLIAGAICVIMMSEVLQIWVAIHCSVFFFISWLSDGFQSLEVEFYDMKRSTYM